MTRNQHPRAQGGGVNLIGINARTGMCRSAYLLIQFSAWPAPARAWGQRSANLPTLSRDPSTRARMGATIYRTQIVPI
jgi:hypothetical protein